MITLKEALKLSNDEICELRKDLSAQIRAKNELGAYIEQLNGEYYEGFDQFYNKVKIKSDKNIIKEWAVFGKYEIKDEANYAEI